MCSFLLVAILLNLGPVSVCCFVLTLVILRFAFVQELELLLSGLPTINVADLQENTEYVNYLPTEQPILWFWEVSTNGTSRRHRPGKRQIRHTNHFIKIDRTKAHKARKSKLDGIFVKLENQQK